MSLPDVKESDKNKRIDGVDRTPAEMIAYQLGWLDLIISWDKDEAAGKKVVTPCEGYKWNELGALYQSFYDRFALHSLKRTARLVLREGKELCNVA